MEKTTIAAIATSPGVGGIGIIRISGEEAFSVTAKIFRPKDAFFDVLNPTANTIKYGHVYDGEAVIDEVLVSFFKAPHSYTTENIVEINCHGGIAVTRKILEKAIISGARIANPGEFTERAFLNGRIDLAQAEAITDLITSKTDKARSIAITQLNGFLSEKLRKIKEGLYDVLVQTEAGIDYPEYDVESVSQERIMDVLEKTKIELKKICDSFEEGRILKEGVNTVILGKPNVGKSSLMNILSRQERAIVTEIPGTTRDTIEESVNIRGIPINIIDTAGIRETEDKIEEIGVEKTKKAIKDADMVIAVFDVSNNLRQEDYEVIDIIKNKKTIIVINKIDLEEKWNAKEIFENKKIISLSAKNKTGIKELEDEIEKLWKTNDMSMGEDVIISNLRHKELIMEALAEIDSALNAREFDLPADILSIHIRTLLEYLGAITGESVSEETIKGIFAKFCLGK